MSIMRMGDGRPGEVLELHTEGSGVRFADILDSPPQTMKGNGGVVFQTDLPALLLSRLGLLSALPSKIKLAKAGLERHPDYLSNLLTLQRTETKKLKLLNEVFERDDEMRRRTTVTLIPYSKAT